MSHFFQLGLVGWPLAHSLSPRLHQAALQACGLEGAYELYPISPLPAGQADLKALLGRLSGGELDGLNITIPHKQSVLPWLDALTPAAQAIGAVNTLVCEGGRLVGENTDAPGFLDDLEALGIGHAMPGSGEPQTALILGAGGAARAVAFALASRGWQVTLAARRPEQARQMAADLAWMTPAPGVLSLPLREAAANLRGMDFTLLVNATPVGMAGHTQDIPWPAEIPLPGGCFVYDLIYNPPETPLLQQAKAQGLPGANGAGMLVHQASRAFVKWTGQPAGQMPVIGEAMKAALRAGWQAAPRDAAPGEYR
jgi:shikimate dehydrogenase